MWRLQATRDAAAGSWRSGGQGSSVVAHRALVSAAVSPEPASVCAVQRGPAARCTGRPSWRIPDTETLQWHSMNHDACVGPVLGLDVQRTFGLSSGTRQPWRGAVTPVTPVTPNARCGAASKSRRPRKNAGAPKLEGGSERIASHAHYTRWPRRHCHPRRCIATLASSTIGSLLPPPRA